LGKKPNQNSAGMTIAGRTGQENEESRKDPSGNGRKKAWKRAGRCDRAGRSRQTRQDLKDKAIGTLQVA
jgi:hypothetical protein